MRALVADLLPVLAPHAMLDQDAGRLVLLVGTAHAEVSLDRLTAACAKLPPHAWPTRVEAWLGEKTGEVAAALQEREQRGLVEEALRVQVTPRKRRGERRLLMCTPYGNLLDVVVTHRPLAGGGPASVSALSREDVNRLAVADPGSRALANTLREELPMFTVADRVLPTGDPVRVISHSTSPYVTSALLDITRFLPGPCPYGALIALPRYSEILLHRVHPQSLHQAARALADLVSATRARAHDPCTDRLLWWADDALYGVSFGRLAGRLRVPRTLRGLIH
ncbi:hypothetical protein [Streptomyces sp. RPT161]|uniref:hypothetical protein n=1 Tax=Streptomyces sp. RPT161 TaxID=3015993 RepID=UPI0022B92C2F|nr:hypothetical protein [Streptomyces sp. RPT161]